MPTEHPPEEDPLNDLFSEQSSPAPQSRRERREALRRQNARHTDSSPHHHPISADLDFPEAPSRTGDRASRRRATYRALPEKPKKKSPWPKVLWTGLVLVVIAAVAASGLYVWNTFEPEIRTVMGWQEPTDYEGEGSGEAYIVITSGDVGVDIARNLENAGVVKTSKAFYSLLLEQHPEPTFQPGTYKLKKQMSSASALKTLQDPDSRVERTVLLREGLTGDTVISLLADSTDISEKEFRKAMKDPTDFGLPKSAPSLEGWLFPALYTFQPDADAHDILQKLVDRTQKELDDANVSEKNREKILTKASIIQREARQEDDFYKVSRVIENRLDKGMKLEMDSTAQYGSKQGSESVWSTKKTLSSDNPWNTYKHKGLPPGPIANPGGVAIKAALHPASGDWLYFVTVNLSTGETVFSTTHDEHEKAVKKLHSWCKKHPESGC